MNHIISYTETLFYYDGIQVFEGRDQENNCFVAVAVDVIKNDDIFALFKVDPSKLQLFRTGEIDLRLLITNRNDKEWFLVKLIDETKPLQIIETQIGDVPEKYLPESGFVISLSSQ